MKSRKSSISSHIQLLRQEDNHHFTII